MSKWLVFSQAVLLLNFVAGFSVQASEMLPAFPGAEGFGAIAVGGRGGRVIKVTNLNASGPGSLQAACAANGPRIVVFDVGGVIRGDVPILHSSITIAGQSAPAPGITIEGRLLAQPQNEERLHDIVVRFLRLRPPPAIGEQGDVIQLPKSERIMLDHLSLAWANDEMIDIIHSSEVTVQWSTIEESDPTGHSKGVPHNYAILSAYPGSGNVSIHHNLFAHHARRLPSMSPQVEGKPDDFRNNVIYNFRDGLSHEGHEPKAPINLVANYYKRGPNANTIHPFQFDPIGKYYVADNFFDGVGVVGDPRTTKVSLPSWIRYQMEGVTLRLPAVVPAVTTSTAEEAYRQVLDKAGAWPRDRVTLRTLDEVRRGTGRWERNAPANPDSEWFLKGLSRVAPEPDADGDGIPDTWEQVHGLDHKNPADHSRLMRSGYTAIEDYLNERAQTVLRAAGL
jgi:pectate lyase